MSAPSLPPLPSEPTDDEMAALVRRAQDGDADARDELFAGVRPRLERWIAARMGPALRSRLDVEDALQDTLLEAHRSLDKFQATGARAFFGWLVAVAENRIRDLVDRFRAAKRDPAREQDLTSKIESARTTPTGRAVRREEHERLLTVMASLPEIHRDVLRLLLVERRAPTDAATILGITVKTLYVRRVRAVQAALELLGESESGMGLKGRTP